MDLQLFFSSRIFKKEIKILARLLVFQTLAVMSLVRECSYFQAVYMLMYFEFKPYCKKSDVLAVRALENHLNFSSLKLKQ